MHLSPNYPSELEKLEILGYGSGGKVYKVRHRRTQSLYALKVVHGDHDISIRRHIVREMEILRRTDSRVRGQVPRRLRPGRGDPVRAGIHGRRLARQVRAPDARAVPRGGGQAGPPRSQISPRQQDRAQRHQAFESFAQQQAPDQDRGLRREQDSVEVVRSLQFLRRDVRLHEPRENRPRHERRTLRRVRGRYLEPRAEPPGMLRRAVALSAARRAPGLADAHVPYTLRGPALAAALGFSGVPELHPLLLAEGRRVALDGVSDRAGRIGHFNSCFINSHFNSVHLPVMTMGLTDLVQMLSPLVIIFLSDLLIISASSLTGSSSQPCRCKL
jgi:hypothetical protein